MLHIGHGNYINKNKIFAITDIESSAAKRKRETANHENKLIDATAGTKTRSMIHLSEGYVSLSSVEADTLNKRFLEVK